MENDEDQGSYVNKQDDQGHTQKKQNTSRKPSCKKKEIIGNTVGSKGHTKIINNEKSMPSKGL